MSHSYIGDLTIKLESPDGSVLTLLSRPGAAETVDDGSDGAGYGDSSNLSITYPIDFSDGATGNAENMGSTISDAQNVCGNDLICDFYPSPGSGLGVSFADFDGENAHGTWSLCFGDAGPGDTGTVDGASLVISTID